MEYIGNYVNIIQQDWINFVVSTPGALLPDGRRGLQPTLDDQNANIYKAWAPENMFKWWKYEAAELPFIIPWPVDLGISTDWWIIKMEPGQCMPMHIDKNPAETTDRYILMLEDYEPGQVLLWDGNLIKDYKCGDMFKIKNVNALHGGGNISNKSRLLAYLTVWH